MNGGQLDVDCADSMRELVSGIVCSDPDTYSEVVLGKTNESYCIWILDSSSWGGAIEISILTKHYAVEIAVVDTQSVRIDRFGEDQGYSERIYLMYDGIHYDPLVKFNQTVFSTTDDLVMCQALSLAAEAKQMRQYTDVKNFSLRCLICQKALRGQDEAQQHAKESGHINFGEN